MAAQALAIVEHESRELAVLSGSDLTQRREVIKDVMHAVMRPDVHYGIIPGTDKTALLKPGAEVLCSTFRLAPRYVITRTDLGGQHREYEVRTTLIHVGTQEMWGEGIGSCSTMEGKYRWRKGERICPTCEQATIIKGKAEYGGGFLCFQRKGGCGAKFVESDQRILSQQVGRIENPDIPDQWNTILKMAKKRSLVDAILAATAASDLFIPVDDEDDDEPAPSRQATPLPATDPVITAAQQRGLFATLKESGISTDDFKRYLQDVLHHEHTREMTNGELHDFKVRIQNGAFAAWLAEQEPEPGAQG
jgi:hypothetical protein